MNRHLVKLAWLWYQKQDTPKVATNPINPRTLGHLDKLVELGVITPAWRKDVLTKNDQDDAEGYAKWNIENALYGNPDVEKVYADWNDPSRPDDINKWKLTPYGQQLKDLHNDLFNKKTANLKKLAWYWTHQPVDNTTKGHLEQLVNLGLIDNKDKDNLLQKDNRDAMNFIRWCADNAVIGNPADDQIYKNYKNNPDYDYDIDKDELTPYGKKLKTFYDTVRKEASYKKSNLLGYIKRNPGFYDEGDLTNTWITQDPATKQWINAPIKDIKRSPEQGITSDWFFGDVYDELLRDARHKPMWGLSLRGYGEAPKEFQRANKLGQDRWLSNRQCWKIYKKLRALSPERIQKIQDAHRAFSGYHPDADAVQAFIDQFGKHTEAGHALYARTGYDWDRKSHGFKIPD